MTASAIPASTALALTRARQVFRFLREYAQRAVPSTRQTTEHHWTEWLRQLPEHPCIAVGEVQLGSPAANGEAEPAEARDSALITVRRPALSAPPKPPDNILDFLRSTWRDPEKEIEVQESRTVVRERKTLTERFADDPGRVQALAEWRLTREAWAATERPARRAMRVFERLYELKGWIDRESERVELLLGDGRLRWTNRYGPVDHPILLQRVELLFDPDVPEFRIVDSDRPAELYEPVVTGGESLSPDQLNTLRLELEQEAYHPLAKEGTAGFLKRIAQLLAPNGLFEPATTEREMTTQPVISRDPVLFLRDRSSGFPAAFDRVLEDLERRGQIPVSLSRLVGVERPIEDDPDSAPWSPWSEPLDVLLSKPANEEQVHIARALERHGAVIVQGPPGTGKSHTIANLIGHLVAHGKRVLVTSHTTKALRVLRDQVVDTLRPLCVALLENDLEGRTQMEEAVKGILSRLTTSSEIVLERDVTRLAEKRATLSRDIERITRALETARASEYAPIESEGVSMLPSEAARWVDRDRAGNDWIPEPVTTGAPLPLSSQEIAQLYETSTSLTPDEEAELEQGAPSLEEVPAVDSFRALVEALEASETPELLAFWERPAGVPEAQHLARLAESVSAAAGDLAITERWQRVLLAAGYDAGSEAELWRELAAMARQGLTRLEKLRPYLVQYDPHLPPGVPLEVVIPLARELEAHVEKGGSLGALNWTLKSRWRRFLREAKCNGRSPRTADELRGLRLLAELQTTRAALALRWKRQAEPAGLPPFDSFGEEPEPSMMSYTQQFDRLLAWWGNQESRLAAAIEAAGFRWEIFRDREIARSQPSTPFERDVSILRGPLLEAVSARFGLVHRAMALESLEQLELVLQQFEGPRSRALYDAVRARDCASYQAAHEALSSLLDKTDTLARRKALLNALEPDAGGWARAIQGRLPGHDAATPPGDPATAWRWLQMNHELERRAALDEVGLTRELQHRSEELRAVTAKLIDRRAWLEQIRRIDLSARQALQGWAQIQRRIGRGTGKRVPSLQADARRLLAEASDAVPVWIMPLTRVAESFDPRKGKFDVVIIDEASQSDVTGLLAWYFGEQVVVVGDHEQVSPLAVGRKVDAVDQLIGRHLAGIPNATLYDGQLSVYDLAKMSFGGTIALREHFRCVPHIIDFSNYLCYNGEIRPLRDPLRVARPHVVEHVVAGSSRDGTTNRREAQELVAILKALIELPQNHHRSMGAISLLGEEQAWLIQQLALEAIGAVELERHRFTAGNAAQFQGDERHIMLLSMVDVSAGAALPLRETDLYRQRYNVAASRARDQLWLVHSLNPHRDLQPGDLRRRLIDHVRSPGARRLTRQQAQERSESELERSVLQGLIDAGYCVEPQVWVGHYRIDMVVSDDNAQVALECDGDRFHAADRIPEDMARQAVLERAGWRFIRVRGTRYYRDPQATMRWVLDELARLGIEPSLDAASPGTLAEKAFQESIVRRAWSIMGELGWLENGVRLDFPR